MYNMITYRGY